MSSMLFAIAIAMILWRYLPRLIVWAASPDLYKAVRAFERAVEAKDVELAENAFDDLRGILELMPSRASDRAIEDAERKLAEIS